MCKTSISRSSHLCRHIHTDMNTAPKASAIAKARAFQSGIGFDPGLECLG